MDLSSPLSSTALLAAVLLLFTWLFVRRRQRDPGQRRARQDALDTVAGWPPEAARVLTVTERQAYELAKRALPGLMVLAQVPLSRFVRVPMRHSYNDWLQRVGQLSADLLICDTGSRVLAVIDIRAAQESERSRRRHERLGKVLKAAGIKVLTWREGELPAASDLRAMLTSILGEQAPKGATTSRPMPLIPVPEIEEILADGDLLDRSMEPVPSAFMDDFETTSEAHA